MWHKPDCFLFYKQISQVGYGLGIRNPWPLYSVFTNYLKWVKLTASFEGKQRAKKKSKDVSITS